jgi:predicted dinucleotide-binding enzyme
MRVTIIGAGNMGRGIGMRSVARADTWSRSTTATRRTHRRSPRSWAAARRPIDLGPLRRARQLENAAFMRVAVQKPLGAGFDTALKLL